MSSGSSPSTNKAYKLFTVLLFTFFTQLSFAQATTFFSFTGTSGYTDPPATGWASSGNEDGAYLRLDPGSVTSPAYGAATNVVFTYGLGSYGSGTGTNTVLTVLNASTNAVIGTYTLLSTTNSSYTSGTVNIGTIAVSFKVKIEATGNGTSVRGTRLRDFVLTGTLAPTCTSQTISGMASTKTVTYGDAAYSAGATASSGLTVSYSSSNTNVATVNSAGTVTIIGAGTATITASQAGNSTYCAASATQALTVNKKALTLTVNPRTVTYGTTTATVTTAANNSYVLTGFANGETSAAGLTGTATYTTNYTATTAAGTSGITVSYSSGLTATNYTFTNASGTVTINRANTTGVTFNNATPYTYNASAQGPTVSSVSPSGSNGAITYSYEGINTTTYGPSATKPTDAGTYTVTATVAQSTNYEAHTSSATAFTIQKAASAIDITGNTAYTSTNLPTAANFTIASQSGSTGAVTWSYVGINGTTYGPTDAVPSAVGEYSVTATLEADDNYNSASDAIDFQITSIALPAVSGPADVIFTYGVAGDYNWTATNINGVANPYSFSASSDALPAGLSFDTATGHLTGTPLAAAANEQYIIGIVATNSGGSSTEYPVVVYIAKKELTISGASASNKVYDATATATLNGTLSGVVAGDESFVTLNKTATFANATAGDNKVVTSTSTITGTKASNYTLTQPTGLTATISKATATSFTWSATGSGAVFTYNGTNRGITLTVNDWVGTPAPSITYTYTTNSTPSSTAVNAGEYTATAVIAGDANHNAVTVNEGNTGSFTISKANQTINGVAATVTRTFGSGTYTLNATSATSSTNTITYQSDNTAVATVAANGTVTIVGAGTATITASQAASANYNATSVSQALTVNKANQTVTNLLTGTVNKTTANADFAMGATTTNIGSAVTYSGGAGIITISGATAHIVGTGSATITATAPGNNNYNALNATFNLNVTYAPATVTATAANNISSTGLTANWNAVLGASSYTADVYTKEGTSGSANATYDYTVLEDVDFPTGTFVADKITFMTGSGGFSTPPRIFSGALRLYSNSSSYITINVTPGQGVKITQIVITKRSDSGTHPYNYYVDGATTATGSGTFVSSANGTTTISSLNAYSSVKFQNTDNIEIARITVYYSWEPVAVPVTGSPFTVAAPATSKVVTGLTPNTTYYYTVKANGGTTASNEITAPTTTTPVLAITANGTQTYTGNPATAPTITKTGGYAQGTVTNVLYGGSSTLPTNVGSYPVTASITGNSTYAVVENVSAGNLVINKATPTVVANPVTAVFGTLKNSVTITGSTSVPGTFAWATQGTAYDQINTLSESSSPTVVYHTVFTPQDTANYNTVTVELTVNITKYSVESVTITDNATPYTYNTTAQGPEAATVSPTVGPGTVSYTYVGTSGTTYGPTSVKPTNAGTYTVTATTAETGSYYSGTSGPVAFTILKATPVINGAATATDITYGQTLAEATISGVTATLSGTDVSGVFAFTNAATAPNAGTASYEITFTPADAANYNSVTTTANVTVVKADQTITFAALPNKNLGDADFSAGATASSGLTLSYTSSNTAVATIDGTGTIHIVGVGSTNVTASQAGNDNYNTAATVQQTLVVGPAVTTWNGSAWSAGVPNQTMDAVINGSYSLTTNGSFEAATLTVNSPLVIASNNTVTVYTHLQGNGGITVENNGALVMADGATQDNTALSNTTVIRHSNALKRLDYTMWGSPVAGNQSLLNFSPLTFAANPSRFYTYGILPNGAEGYISVANPGATQFAPGTGYLIRTPNALTEDAAAAQIAAGLPAITVAGYNTGAETNSRYVHQGTFTGVPNNGNISVALQDVNGASLAEHYIAVSNPYPSPINIQAFLTENQDVISGTIYLWRKRNVLGGTASSYVQINNAGVVRNMDAENEEVEGGDIDGTIEAMYQDGDEDNWILSPGQGFIVGAQNAGTIDFNNAMRVAAPTTGGQPFFRTNGTNDEPVTSKWWLNLTGANNTFSQSLVAYMPQATFGKDYGYDGNLLSDAATKLYSQAVDENFGIQARPSFTATDVVPMGFSVASAGQYNLSLERVTGVFAQGQDIYIKDNLLGTTNQLGEEGYTFTSDAGTFDSRFEVVYQTDGELGTNQPQLEKAVMVYQSEGAINITTGNIEINGVTIYDIRGRKLYAQTGINATQASVNNLNVAQQVLIVEVNTVNGIVTKKIIY